MTKPLFFDSDCLSAFLWVGDQSILAQLYPGRIIIPKPVYDELSSPVTPHLKSRIDVMLARGQATIKTIDTASQEFKLYYKLTVAPDAGRAVIGRGEAASIAMAKEASGIVASNNLRDVKAYVEQYALMHVTTGDILMEALSEHVITLEQGDAIWASMLAKRRKLGAPSFAAYISRASNPPYRTP